MADTPSTRPLLEKLGVKAGMAVAVIGVEDDGFLDHLRERANVTLGEPSPDRDMIFYGVEAAADMARLADLRRLIKPNGAVWVVFRKGRKDFNENDVLRLGLESGLVDVKVVRFSDTHSATKWVIRKSER